MLNKTIKVPKEVAAVRAYIKRYGFTLMIPPHKPQVEHVKEVIKHVDKV